MPGMPRPSKGNGTCRVAPARSVGPKDAARVTACSSAPMTGRRRRPTWWTVRLLPSVTLAFEVALFHSGCVLNWHTVTIDETGGVHCTCRSGREGFRRTKRGWCDHVEAVMRSALRGYLPIWLSEDRLKWYPPCHGCGPTCRTFLAHCRASLAPVPLAQAS